MTSLAVPSQCMACAHRKPMERACTAFPDGIPGEIWDNQADHRQPYPDDHGVQWESNGEPYPNTPSR